MSKIYKAFTALNNNTTHHKVGIENKLILLQSLNATTDAKMLALLATDPGTTYTLPAPLE